MVVPFSQIDQKGAEAKILNQALAFLRLVVGETACRKEPHVRTTLSCRVESPNQIPIPFDSRFTPCEGDYTSTEPQLAAESIPLSE